MKNSVLFVVVSLLLTCGCASLVTNRGIELRAESIGVNEGLDIFRNTADQFRLVVQGPIYRTAGRYYYEAWPPTNQFNNRLHLLMDIDNAKEVTFSAVVYGTAQDLPTAQAAAEWFRQELEKRHIQYKLWQATAYPPP